MTSQVGIDTWCTGDFDSRAFLKTRVIVKWTYKTVLWKYSFMLLLAWLLLRTRNSSSCFDFFGVSLVWIYSIWECLYITYFSKHTTDFYFFLPQTCLSRNPYVCFQGLPFLLLKVCHLFLKPLSANEFFYSTWFITRKCGLFVGVWMVP